MISLQLTMLLASARSSDYAANMEKQRLLRTLDQLQAELSQTQRVDPETLARLEKLADDVRRSLDEGVDFKDDVEPVSGLRDLLLKFEADHPQLSTTVGRVADALAALGI
jgi:Domain of unknown function (DUF4404)